VGWRDQQKYRIKDSVTQASGLALVVRRWIHSTDSRSTRQKRSGYYSRANPATRLTNCNIFFTSNGLLK
jgi:hypothetical protein